MTIGLGTRIFNNDAHRLHVIIVTDEGMYRDIADCAIVNKTCYVRVKTVREIGDATTDFHGWLILMHETETRTNATTHRGVIITIVSRKINDTNEGLSSNTMMTEKCQNNDMMKRDLDSVIIIIDVIMGSVLIKDVLIAVSLVI